MAPAAVELPAVEEYLWALQAVAPTVRQRQMLQAHYDAPEHTITATQMARAVGFNGFEAANLQYGRFAKRVRDALNWHHGADLQIYIFNSFAHYNGEWHWIMHPELAEALEELGWVEPVD